MDRTFPFIDTGTWYQVPGTRYFVYYGVLVLIREFESRRGEILKLNLFEKIKKGSTAESAH